HVIEPDLMAKRNRRRIAAVLAANAELQPGPGCTPALGGDAHQFADALHIQRNERVVFEYPEPLVSPDKARGVVPRKAEDRLGQIVRTKAEELRSLGNFAREQRGARQLDHRPDEV